MGLGRLLGQLSRCEASFERSPGCSEATAQAVWSKYTSYRRAGYITPFHARRRPHKIKIFAMGAYIIKEYTGGRPEVEKELAILRQLQHPNLMGFLFIADQGSRISIVMEWAGESLREHRAVSQPQQYCGSESLARHVMAQLTSGLVFLHNKGIIHRDIKPDNIGVHVDHRVQLFDWGEACTLEQLQALSERELARQVGVAGSPAFMAPEALNYLTDRDRDPASGTHHLRGTLTTALDVWGLGTVLFFLLCGRDIFTADECWELDALADVASASTGVELPPGTQASEAARDFLAACLQRDPRARASAKELAQHPWLRGAASVSDMAAAAAAALARPAGAAGASSSGRATAVLSVLAESFSSDEDGGAEPDALAASLALASGVGSLSLAGAAAAQQQQQQQQLGQGLARSLRGSHTRLDSWGSCKSLTAVEEEAAAAALASAARGAGEAVCEVRLKPSPSGASLISLGSLLQSTA